MPTVAEILDGLPSIGTADAEVLAHTPWESSPAMTRRMARVEEGSRWRGARFSRCPSLLLEKFASLL
jgi:hypothetical protein